MLWDVDFRTAVAQAELEDRDIAGAYHRVAFPRTDTGEPVYIETTRPELIPACVALVAHPDDERYRSLFGQTVRTPLFGVEVEVMAHELAEPDKGSGIAMICTFGDVTDVTWWRELRLPTRNIVGVDGRIIVDPPAAIAAGTDAARAAYAELAGKTVKQAQARIVEMLAEAGASSTARPSRSPIPVKFYEQGDRPLEIVTSRQWYIRNGGRDDDLREALLTAGQGADLAPALHAGPLRELGQRPERRLAHLPAALLRRPVPGLVPARRGRRDRPRPPDPRRRGPPAGRPVERSARRVRRVAAGPARRLRRRPRRDGHLGDLVAHPADRGRLG